ncbi:hypothetical protein, partial [Stenotrophomonas hibiscicola]|uniref:hypothetical protein n=1 Tax=Stenotrophomonas hibiscicola TaxID=86189 RepID=UPI0032086ED0
REYVPVGSVAPSMALTPPQPDPPRLRQLAAICWNLLPMVLLMVLLMVVGADRWSARGRIPLQRNRL